MRLIFDAARGRRRWGLYRSLLVGTIVATAGLMPALLNGQDLNNTSLNGTNITYYPSPPAKCKDDCNGNPNCKGWTWIRPGAYKRGDPAMCYLLSAVTTQVKHPCCISGIKAAQQPPPTTVSLTGDWNLSWSNDEQKFRLLIPQQQGNTFSGTFEGSGTIKGQVSGNRIDFDRENGQHWTAQLVNNRQMINGTWSGPGAEYHKGKLNWHAEKR